jgi:hypothetical protein
VIGGVLGAYVLANTLPEVARRWCSPTLALIGLFLLWRGFATAAGAPAAGSSSRSGWWAASSTRPAAAAGDRS